MDFNVTVDNKIDHHRKILEFTVNQEWLHEREIISQLIGINVATFYLEDNAETKKIMIEMTNKEIERLSKFAKNKKWKSLFK